MFFSIRNEAGLRPRNPECTYGPFRMETVGIHAGVMSNLFESDLSNRSTGQTAEVAINQIECAAGCITGNLGDDADR